MADSETQQVTSKTAGSESKFKALAKAIIESLSAAAAAGDEHEFNTNLPALVDVIIASIPASGDAREFKKNFLFSIDAIIASAEREAH